MGHHLVGAGDRLWRFSFSLPFSFGISLPPFLLGKTAI
jgi:hypothetical protein